MAKKRVNGFIESLSRRVVPNVLGNVFPDEKAAIKKVSGDFKNARDIYGRVKTDVNETFAALGPTKNLVRKLREQARKGQFGLSQSDLDALDDKMMGLDGFDDGSFDDSLFDGKDAEVEETKDKGGVVNIKKIFAPRISKGGGADSILMKATGQQTSILSSQLGQLVTVQAHIGNAQISLLTSLNNQIGSIGELLNTNTKAHYEAADEFFKMSAGIANNYSEVMDMLGAKLKKEKEAEDRRIAAKMGVGNDFNSMFDVSKPMAGAEGISNMLFGQIGAVREAMSKLGADPLGTILGATLGFGLRKYGGSAVNAIKNITGSIGYRTQAMFEKWADDQFKGGTMNMLKGLIGSSLKSSRVRTGDVKLGSFNSEEAIPFDTNTRKAIVDVIPMYLSKILNAINKTDGFEVYDEKSGKFVNSKQLSNDAKSKIKSMQDGNFTGGLGNELFSLQFDTDQATFEKIREKMIAKAMSADSFKTDLKKLRMGNRQAQEVYDNYIAGLSGKEFNELTKTFQGHKFELGNAMKGFNEEFSSGGASQAAILENIGLKVRDETEGRYGRRRRRRRGDNGIDPVPGQDNVDPIDLFGDIMGRLGRGGNGSNGGSGAGGNGAGGFGDRLRGLGGRLRDRMNGGIGADGRPTGGGLRGAFDMIKNGTIRTASDLKNALGGRVGNGDFKAVFDMMRSGDISSFSDFKEALKMTSVGSKAGDILSDIRGSVSNAGRAAGNRVSRAFYGLMNLMGVKKESIDAFGKKISNSLKSLFGKGKGIIGADGQKISGEALEAMSFKDLISSKLDQGIIQPLKSLFGKGNGIIGADGKQMSDDVIRTMSFKDLLSNKLDYAIVRPMKSLFGKGKGLKDADGKTIPDSVLRGMNFTSLISMKFDQAVMTPMKKLFAKGSGLKDAEGNTISSDDMAKMNIFSLIGMKLDQSVMTPMKNLLLGKNSIHNGGDLDPSKASIFTVLKSSMDEYISKPIKRLLFGEGSEETSFLKNLGNLTSPFFNKLFFGNEKASKAGLADNFREFGSRMWAATHAKFIKPAMDAAKNLFGPVFSEFKETLKGSVKDFMERFNIDLGKGFRAGAKGFLTTVFGDETIKTLKTNLVDPINKAAKTISDSLSNVFKFLLRIPANLVSGITDMMKYSRMKKGKGNYSEEERNRLSLMGESNRFFDFKNLGGGNRLDMSIEGLKNGLKSSAKSGFHSVRNGAKTVRDGVADAAGNIRDAAGNVIGNIGGRFGSAKLSGKDADKLKESIRGRLGLGGSKTGIGEGVSTPLNGVGLLNSIKKIQTDVKTHIVTSITKIRNVSEGMFTFMKKNMGSVSDKLTTLIKLLRTGGKTTKGKDGSFTKSKGGIIGRFLGGFGKMGNFIQRIIEIPMNIVISFGQGIAKVADAIKSVPARIIKGAISITASLGRTAMTIMEGTAKLLRPVMEMAITGVKTTIKVAGSAISASFNLAVKAAVGLGNMLNTVAKGAVTAIKVAGDLTVSIGKGAWVVTKAFANIAKQGTVLAAKFAWATTKLTASVIKNIGGRLLGARIRKNEVSLQNANALIAASKINPLHVYVTDGKIATYQKKERRATRFNATELPLRRKKEKQDEKKNKLLEMLLPLTLGLKGFLRKAITMMGMKNAAGMLGGGRGGMGDIIGGTDGGRGRGRGRGAGGGRWGRLGRAAGRFGGNLMRGGLKGFGISALGNLGADLLFDEGSTAHNVTSKAATYGGWGATIGSIIPGVGTAIGALVGTAIGGIMGLFPEIEEYIGKGWDWMKEKIGKFISWAWDGIKSVGKSIWSGISWVGEKVSAAWEWYKGYLGKVWDGIKAAGKAVWDGISWVGGKIADGWNWLVGGVKKIWGGITAGYDWVTNKVSEGWEWYKGYLGGLWDNAKKMGSWVSEKASQGWEATKKAAGEYWDKTKEVAGDVGGWMSSKWDSIKGGFFDTFGWVKDKFSGAKEQVTAVADGSLDAVIGHVKSMFSFIGTGIGNIGKSVTSGFMSMTGNVGVGMKTMVSKGITGFRAMLGKLSIDVPFFGKLTLPGGLTEEEAANQMRQIENDSKSEYGAVKTASEKLKAPEATLKTWNPEGSNKITKGILDSLTRVQYTAAVSQSTQAALAAGKGKVDPELVSGSNIQPMQVPNQAPNIQSSSPANVLPPPESANIVGSAPAPGMEKGIAPPEQPFAGNLGQSIVTLADPQNISYSQIPNSDGSIDSTLNMLAAVGIATGVDPRLLMGISHAESGFKATAQNPGKGQTAGGLFQFIDDTWNGMLKQYGPRFGLPANTSKHDPRANSLMGALYIRDNLMGLQKTLNRPLVTTDAYMAHFLGLGGARNFFRQSPDAPASSFLTPDGLAANRTIAYNSNGQMRTTSGVYQVMANKLNKGSKYVDKVMGYAARFGKHGFPPSMPGAGGMPLLNGQSGDGGFSPSSLTPGGGGGTGSTGSGLTLFNGMNAEELLTKMGGGDKLYNLMNRGMGDEVNVIGSNTGEASLQNNSTENTNASIKEQTDGLVGYESGNKMDTATATGKAVKEGTIEVNTDNSDITGEQSKTNELLGKILQSLNETSVFAGNMQPQQNTTNVSAVGSNPSGRSVSSPPLSPSKASINIAKGGADL